jgi:hypothetical protein
LTVVGIVTRDREAALRDGVVSYLTNCRQHARTPEVVIADGSDQPDSGARIRNALQSVRRGGEAIRYAGFAERLRYAEALQRESSVDPDVIEFALFGDPRCARSTGANRNALLVDTLGSLVFSADDDTLCRPRALPAVSEGASFTRAYDPTEFWFFPDRRQALEFGTPADVDVLGSHEPFLGRTLAELGDESEASGAVTLTLQGLVGDSGMGSPRYFLTLEGPSRARLLASRDSYHSALRSREVWRAAPRPTVASTAFCMTPFFGFDNRRLLPPFFPVERNSDGVFGLMVHRYVAGSHVAFLPLALVHDPQEPRSFEENEARTEAAGIRVADVLIATILSHNAGSDEEGDAGRLRRLATYLSDVGSLASADFEAFVRTALQMRTLTAMTLLETRLREYAGVPDFWADDVRGLIATLRGTTARRDYIVPSDLCRGRDLDGARDLTRELVWKYGELLNAWPALVKSARRLRARGCRVSDSL